MIFCKGCMKVDWLNRFTDVMDCLSEGPIEGMGISEISRITNLSKGTVHRMLSSMTSQQLTTQNSITKLYNLGPRAMIWGSQFLQSQDPTGLMGRYCEEISDKTGYYSYLCRFQTDQVYCIYTHQPSNLRNKYFVHVGQRLPFYCSAASKAILAYQDPSTIKSIISSETFSIVTPFTLTTQIELERELNQVLTEGAAQCFQELEMGVSALSVPIFYEDNKTTMSLSIVGECNLIESDKEKLVNELLMISKKASEHLHSMHKLSSLR